MRVASRLGLGSLLIAAGSGDGILGAMSSVGIAELPRELTRPRTRRDKEVPTLVLAAVSGQPGALEPRATLFGYEPGNEADFERLYKASYGKILASLIVVLGDRAAYLARAKRRKGPAVTGSQQS